MTTAQADGDRPIKVAKRMKNSAVKEVGLVRRNALTHIAKHNAGHFLQQSRVTKMKEHPVPLVGFCADVFKKKNTGAINVRSKWCAERLDKNRDAAASESTVSKSGPQNPKALFDTK